MKYKIGDFTTRGGFSAKILLIDERANYPLIGAVEHDDCGWYVSACWDADGVIYDESKEDGEDPEYKELYDEEDDESYSSGDLPL